MHILVIAFYNILFDNIKVTFLPLCPKLLISAHCSYMTVSCQIYLHIRVRKNARSDISSVHHDTFLLCKFLLQFHKLFSYILIGTAGRCHFPHRLCTDKTIYISSVQPHNLLTVLISYRHVCIRRRRTNPVLFVRPDSQFCKIKRHGAVHRSCVDIDISLFLCD